jgi:O-acetyl-ADP-ribose deacetylase (regulator of RNase III)
MSLINLISVPTTSGIKTIEVHNDDITKMTFDVDLLVLSAYHNKYLPAPGTVIEALYENTGISLLELSQKPLLDLRSSLHCWVSNKIDDCSFKHIICIEGIKTSIKESGTGEDALSNLFGTIALLQYKNLKAGSIALPILGAGFQKNSIDAILPKLIEKAIDSLNINTSLKTIYFVEVNKEKAKLIDETINNYLHRGSDKLELVFDDPLLVSSLELILAKLVQIKNNSFYNNKTIKNLINKINNKNLRFFELGILCRKLEELLLADISDLKSDNYISLFEYINDLKSKNVAEWMITYLHTLRVFGNFMAHEGESSDIPSHMEKSEVIVFTHALNRLLDFYINFKNKKR